MERFEINQILLKHFWKILKLQLYHITKMLTWINLIKRTNFAKKILYIISCNNSDELENFDSLPKLFSDRK